MLENYDNTWREAVGEKSSTYFNVSPGTYVYRVRAYNSEGVKAEKAITIRIYPPWWQTWWFSNIRNHFTGHEFLSADPMVVTSQIPAATGTYRKRKTISRVRNAGSAITNEPSFYFQFA